SVTFGANFRISDTSFPPVFGFDPAVTPDYMGDYDKPDADNSFFYYSWGDNRDLGRLRPLNQADVRLARIPVAGPAGPTVIYSLPANSIDSPQVNSVEFTFSRDMDPASFSIADDVASFTGPGGVDLLSQVTSSSWVDARTLHIGFNSQQANGSYAMTIGP